MSGLVGDIILTAVYVRFSGGYILNSSSMSGLVEDIILTAVYVRFSVGYNTDSSLCQV